MKIRNLRLALKHPLKVTGNYKAIYIRATMRADRLFGIICKCSKKGHSRWIEKAPWYKVYFTVEGTEEMLSTIFSMLESEIEEDRNLGRDMLEALRVGVPAVTVITKEKEKYVWN